jgi:myxalamid-type polyketide synthase MxaE and MxaD
VLRLFQALDAAKVQEPPKVWLLTRGAQSLGERERADVWQSPLWGLGRVLALEQPANWGGLIDLDPLDANEEVVGQAAEVLPGRETERPEDQIAIRRGRPYVPRLARTAAASGSPEIRTDGTYLITGGCGALGLRVAAWLVDRGARHLVLVGRRGPGPSAEPAILALESAGARVRIVRADVASRSDMEKLFGELRGDARPPLLGVVHAAGVVAPTPVADLTPAHVAEAFRAKVEGACLLDEFTSDLPLDFFVLFSSASAVWGSRGLAHYAAANHFLDAVAHDRRARGLAALSVNWGPWGGGGMTSAEGEASFTQIGVTPLDPVRALRALGSLIRSGATQATVADVNWSVFTPIYTARARRPLLEGLDSSEAAHAGEPAGLQLRERLRTALLGDRDDVLTAHVREEVARILGFDLMDADAASQGFFQLGMDSLMAVDLRRRLEASVGQALPPTLAFDFPSVSAIAGYLRDEVLAAEFAGDRSDVAPDREPDADDPLSMVEQMSDEEVDRLFAAKMSSQGGSR